RRPGAHPVARWRGRPVAAAARQPVRRRRSRREPSAAVAAEVLMAARRAFLGVDCGTQSTKVLVVDATTEEILGVGRAPHELIERADGTREQDPAWWVAALQTAVRAALADTDVEVAGIGVSGQQHGLVCLDGADRPVRPAKL